MSETFRLSRIAISHLVLKKYEKSLRASRRMLLSSVRRFSPLRRDVVEEMS